MNTYIIQDLVNLFSCLVLALVVFYKNPKNKAIILLVLYFLSAAYLDFIDLNILLAESIGRARIYGRLYIPGMLFSVSLLFHFVLLFTEQHDFLKKKVSYVIIYLPTVIFTLIDIPTGLLSGEIIRQVGSWSLTWKIFYAHHFISIIAGFVMGTFGLISLFLIISSHFKAKSPVKRKQVKFVIGGIIFAAILEFIFDALLYFGIQIPRLFGHTVLGIFISIGMVKYDSLYLNPITAAETITTAMSDLLLILTKDFKIAGINKAVENTLGFKEEELLGQNVFRIFAKEDYADTVFKNTTIPKLLKGNIITDEETAFFSKSGRNIPISLSCTTIKDKKGDLHGIICIGRDITERKYHEEEIKNYYRKVIQATADIEEERAKQQAVLLAIGDGLIITDKNGWILLVNEVFERILGWKLHEIKGRRLSKVVPMQDTEGREISHKARIRPLLLIPGRKISWDRRTYKSSTSNYYYINKDNKKISVRVTVTPIIHRWEIIGMVEVFHEVEDVNKQKSQEDTDQKDNQV
ncbi:PAS domain S-box protein [Candidatus Dojkabacteria bacterium]|nr:PAS domain S-box protein [Candidatus Dojkabacteria bacterium]